VPSAQFYGLSLMGLYAVVILEVLLLGRWKGQPMRWREVAVNMNSGQAVLWLLHGARILIYAWVYSHASLGLLAELPMVVVLPISFLLWDFAFYASHRAHHTFPLLWEVHAVHHQGEAFNISLAVRNAWLQVLTPTPFFLALALIGVPVEVYLTVGALHYTIQLYNHNGLFIEPSPLDALIVTPRHHRLHHAKHPAYRDRNFGSSLVIWDRLLGTFAAERPSLPVDIGLDTPPRTENPLWLNLAPLTDRLGWTPRAPAQPAQAGAGWLMAGSVLHFILLCQVIMLPTALAWPRGALMAFIIVGTLLLGGAADGQRGAIWGWAILAAAGFVASVGTLSLVGAGSALLLGLALLHGLYGLRALQAA